MKASRLASSWLSDMHGSSQNRRWYHAEISASSAAEGRRVPSAESLGRHITRDQAAPRLGPSAARQASPPPRGQQVTLSLQRGTLCNAIATTRHQRSEGVHHLSVRRV